MEKWTKYFKVVGIVPGPVVTHRFGPIDFSDMSLPVEKIKNLYEAKCPYLQLTEQGKEFLYGVIAPPPKAYPALKPIPVVAANPRSEIILESESERNKDEMPNKELPIDYIPKNKPSGIAGKKSTTFHDSIKLDPEN